jgi:acid phosphatase
MIRRGLPLVLLAALAAGCAARTAPSAPATRVPPGSETPAAPASAAEGLDAVLWTQTSVEYRATALQAYALARLQLDRALADRGWTAATEQVGRPFEELPPAVILDADETVVDNSAFQARLIEDGDAYNEANWSAWVNQRKATAVPGAVAFTQYARERGVTVFYVTNRNAPLETATRENMAALGFPLDEARDTVLTRLERPEWVSDKTTRREHVARDFRILLLVGDDLGDFLPNRGTVAERDARVAPYAAWWGTKWIALPNPMYGSWMSALTAAAPGNPAPGKRQQLRPMR